MPSYLGPSFAFIGVVMVATAYAGKGPNPNLGVALGGIVSSSVGGTGVTTYAENIGVMAATKIYSTAVFLVAALMAVVLGFSPKFGALTQAISLPVMGGVSIVVFGLMRWWARRSGSTTRWTFQTTKT